MITLDLPPELEARLAAEAQVHGLDLVAYATRVLEQVATPPASEAQPKRRAEELAAFLKAMAAGSEKLPPLSTESFSRESFYHERG